MKCCSRCPFEIRKPPSRTGQNREALEFEPNSDATSAIRVQKLVGGPGFEPGASRSRITRLTVQVDRFLRISVRFFGSGYLVGLYRGRCSAGLLHEVLQEAGKSGQAQR